VLGVVVSIVLGLAVTSRVVHAVGAAPWGSWAVCQQLLAYVGLVDLGVSVLLARDVARLRGTTRDPSTLRDLLAAALKTATILMAGGVLVLNVILLVSARDSSSSQLPNLLSIAGNALLLSLPLRLGAFVLSGLLDVDFVAFQSSVLSVLAGVAMLVVVHFGLGVVGIASAWAVQQILSGVVTTMRARYLLSEEFPSCRQIMRARLLVGRQNGWVTLNQVCNVALNASDVIVAGRLLGFTEAARYSITSRAFNVLGAVPGAAAQASAPFLAALSSGEKTVAGRAAAALTLCIGCVAAWLVACVLVANRAFVSVWVGEAQFGGITLTAILGVLFLLTQVGGTLVQIAFNFGNVVIAPLTAFASSVLFIVSCGPLTTAYGILGPAVALVGSILAASFPFLAMAAWRASSGFGGMGPLLRGWAFRSGILVGLSWALSVWFVRGRTWPAAGALGAVTLMALCLFAGYLYREPLRPLVHARIVASEGRAARSLERLLVAGERWALLTHWKSRASTP
jgi:O-antigen/teichoic acid export membrane protein